MFNIKQIWRFPTNDYGQITGISDAGLETFMGTPMKSLAREICQNSLDAHLDNGLPTRVEFSVFEISPHDIPDFSTLEDAFKKALSFWSIQENDKAKTFFNGALDTIRQSHITCLRISDFNTTGLTGSRAEYNSPWCNLIKSSGASDKSGTNGGSFGIGKSAPFACSALRTIIYSTSDINGICASQGVSKLASFKNKNNEITQGTGFYGNEKNSPDYKQLSIDPNYKREKSDHGTDIFIIGFNGDTGWQDQMIASILDGFLYAVYNETLVAYVDGNEISKSTLPKLMVSHKAYFQEHADEYYQALTDEKSSRVFEREITDDPEIAGKLTLKLMIMPEFHRRVAMIRQTGMKIKDKGNISALIPFAGVLFIEGDKINGYLRSLENPQHLEWEVERATNKAKAKRLLAYLTKFIKSSLEEMKNDDSEEALDPSVGEYLSAPQEDDVPNQDKSEAIQDTIKDIKVRVSEITPKTATAGTDTTSTNEQTAINDDNGEIEITDLPGDGGSGDNHNGGNGGDGGGHNPGDGSGDTPIEHRKTLSSIAPVNVRNMVRNKATGEYTIVFTPSESATDGVIEVFMSAESQNYDAAILSATCSDCPAIKFSRNRVTGLIFTERAPLRVNIQLDYHDYCSLEVKAYGNKV